MGRMNPGRTRCVLVGLCLLVPGGCAHREAGSEWKSSTGKRSGAAAAEARDQNGSQRAVVEKIRDGDTIVVRLQPSGRRMTVRLLGIDCPETEPGKQCRSRTARGRSSCAWVERRARAATGRAAELLVDQNVTLACDGPCKTGHYGRALRYVHLADGHDFGLLMIRDGYCEDFGWGYPHPRGERYKNAENTARLAGRGIWKGEQLLPIVLGKGLARKLRVRQGDVMWLTAPRPSAPDVAVHRWFRVGTISDTDELVMKTQDQPDTRSGSGARGVTSRTPPPDRPASATPPAEETESAGRNKASSATPEGMVYVPAGRFWMGCNPDIDTECESDEKPGHEVHLDGFFIDKTEVTMAQYRRCVEDGVCTHHWDDGRCYIFEGSGPWRKGRLPASFRDPKQPAVCINWDEAHRYCQWAGKRLPTEAEWEKAARGEKGHKFPWGNQRANCRLAVIHEDGNGCGRNTTWPVCSKPRGNSPYGLCDAAGNVWEWVSDWYRPGQYAEGRRHNPRGPATGKYKVLRGGSWHFNSRSHRAATRTWNHPHARGCNNGFRCARSH